MGAARRRVVPGQINDVKLFPEHYRISPTMRETLLTMKFIFSEAAIVVSMVATVIMGYLRLSSRIAKLEIEVHRMGQQARTDRTETIMNREGVEIRLDTIENRLAGIDALLRENIRELHTLVEKHDRKLDQYDQAITNFFKDYDIKKKQ